MLDTGKYVVVLAGMGEGMKRDRGLNNRWGGITGGGFTSGFRFGGTLCGEWAIGTCFWCAMFFSGGFCCCGTWAMDRCNRPGILELFGPKNWFTFVEGFVEKSGTKMEFLGAITGVVGRGGCIGGWSGGSATYCTLTGTCFTGFTLPLPERLCACSTLWSLMIAAVELGGIPDTTLLSEQQKLQLPAVCTEKAVQGDLSYRQHYSCFLEDY